MKYLKLIGGMIAAIALAYVAWMRRKLTATQVKLERRDADVELQPLKTEITSLEGKVDDADKKRLEAEARLTDALSHRNPGPRG